MFRTVFRKCLEHVPECPASGGTAAALHTGPGLAVHLAAGVYIAQLKAARERREGSSTWTSSAFPADCTANSPRAVLVDMAADAEHVVDLVLVVNADMTAFVLHVQHVLLPLHATVGLLRRGGNTQRHRQGEHQQ